MYHTIIIVGNLGKDPEMRYLPSGQAVTSFNVATNRQYTGQMGNLSKKPSGSASRFGVNKPNPATNILRKAAKCWSKAGLPLILPRVVRSYGHARMALPVLIMMSMPRRFDSYRAAVKATFPKAAALTPRLHLTPAMVGISPSSCSRQ